MKAEPITVVEFATPEHAAQMMHLARAHHAELGGEREFTGDALWKHAKWYGSRPERHEMNCWIAYVNNDEPVGYIVGKIDHPYGCNEEKWAYMEMMYARPAYRNILTLAALLRKFDEWARQEKCKRQQLGVEFNDDLESAGRMLRLYGLLGYKLRGYVTAKDVDYTINNEQEERVA